MKRALIGNGGHASEIMMQMNKNLVRFVEDEFYVKEKNVFPLSSFKSNDFEIQIAISDPKVRERIISKLPRSTIFFTFIHPTVLIGKNVKIGNGSFIGLNSVLTCNISIGSHAILNRFCQIGHDCVIGDFLTMMPNAVISGNCKIGNNFYLGTNSSVREKIEILNDVTVGLNSGVVKNIKDSGKYGGVPVKKLK
jgi:sugar O-acyltransferase (sialic acid O-acetyltransferase NeuD family)